jgi:N-acylglucosamine-6-phosphate 2-epimerase
LAKLLHGLIVSCQAEAGEPLYGPSHMAAMARAAAAGGAAGIRANGPADIAAIRAAIGLPIIGLYKANLPGTKIRITPTPDHARQIADAGADVIALDATARPNAEGLAAAERIQQARQATGLPVLADIATFEEGLAAEQAGAAAVATTLSGYSDDSPAQEDPDLDLVRRLAAMLRVPLIAEGRIWTPDQAAEAIALGAFAVVVGTAISRPQVITQRFVARLRCRS